MNSTNGASKTHSSTYRPDIDGLRALAILPVILFHASLGCSGGFVGVDVFFVISGFLISSLILKEIDGGAFSLITFWERRIRRILPALVLVVFVSFIAAWFLFLPIDFKHFGKIIIGQAMLISNVIFWRDTDYFAPNTDTKPLLHTWSLAVEEQFYLIFPLLLILLARCRRLSLSKTIVCMAVGSFALSIFESYSHPVAAFYLLPARAWELLMGAWLAATPGRFPARPLTAEILGWLGIGLVCYSVFFYDKHTRFPGLAAMPPCLGAALIIFSSGSKLSGIGRILSFKPVVYIGLISYSLYLWHWPLLIFSKYQAREQQSVGLRAALLAASIALAVLSLKYVESPIRKRRILHTRPQIFGFAAISMALLLVSGVFIYCKSGIPSRFSAQTLKYADAWSHSDPRAQTSLKQARAGQFVELGSRDTNQPVKILIWGDSHAMALTPAFNDLCRRYSWRGIQATYPATAPVLEYISTEPGSLHGDSPAFANAVLAFITQNHVKIVVMAAFWSAYPAFDQASDSFETNLLRTVSTLVNLGVKVYVVKNVPFPDFDVPRIAAITSAKNGDLDLLGVSQEKYEQLNRELRPAFERISQMGATVLDPSSYFLNSKGIYGVVRNDQVLYCDSHHLSLEGSRLLSPLFEPIFNP
jgi:peptidoglycan/LPS O-acetylase OafA/YrhL